MNIVVAKREIEEKKRDSVKELRVKTKTGNTVKSGKRRMLSVTNVLKGIQSHSFWSLMSYIMHSLSPYFG
jgi:hypothetical protein